MASICGNLSQVKLVIKQVIDNLQHLSDCERMDIDIEKIKINTDHLLTQLENIPLERLKCKLKKRQRKKFTRNLLNRDNRHTNDRIKCLTDAEVCSESKSLTLPSKLQSKCNHNFIVVKKECQRFLQTFELLEQLHMARGHNSSETCKFGFKLRQLKSIWNCLLNDKLQEETSNDVTIQQEWNEVLFGPPEKTYFHNKADLHDFIRKRQIWDSCINTQFGSTIPIGWILPQEEIKEQWRPYLAPTA